MYQTGGTYPKPINLNVESYGALDDPKTAHLGLCCAVSCGSHAHARMSTYPALLETQKFRHNCINQAQIFVSFGKSSTWAGHKIGIAIANTMRLTA